MTSETETIDISGSNTNLSPKCQKSQPYQYKHHCFTWNNYEQRDIDILVAVFQHLCFMYVFQEETGEQGTPHLQGVISLKKRARWTEFGLPKAIHWEPCRHVTKAYAYCSKEETRTGQVFCLNFTVKKEIKLLREDQFFDWQKQIIEIIDNEPDDRNVFWFWSEQGKMGKSTFAKYLVVKKNALFFEEGKKADIMKLIYDADMDKKNVVVIDVPRANGNNVSYKSIESIKNGLIYSSKYEGGYKVFNAPHVIIFANVEPDMTKLSDDRWNVFNIDI